MARPLRVDLAGGVYHVTSRGDGREDIYLSDEDREAWLVVLGQVCTRFNWVCHAWCQMTNHYHILIETPEANLSQGMRQLNGVYTQYINRTHRRVGHVFQGRFKGILVEKDSYLLELARYVVLNPLRARMVKRLEDWPWSSYLAMCDLAPRPVWLQTGWLLAQFGEQHDQAIAAYVRFVHEGARLPSVWTKLQAQVFLGSEAFVQKMQALAQENATFSEIPHAQRRAITQPLALFEAGYPRKQAMAQAYLSGQHSMAMIARHFGVHYTTVSRAVHRVEQEQRQEQKGDLNE